MTRDVQMHAGMCNYISRNKRTFDHQRNSCTWAVIFAGIMFLNTNLKGGSGCPILLRMFMTPIMHAYKHGSSINADFQHAGNSLSCQHPSSLKWMAGSTVLASQFLLESHITFCKLSLKTCTIFLATIIKRCTYCSLSMLVSQTTKPKYKFISDSYLNKLLHYTNTFKECS